MPSTTQTVSLGKHKWLVGLSWDYAAPGAAAGNKLLEAAVADAAELARQSHGAQPVGKVLYRHNMGLHIGVASGSKTFLKKRPLLLLPLLAEPANRWIGRFMLENGLEWVVMIYDGIPMPDGDQVLPTEQASQVWSDWITQHPDIVQRDTKSWAETVELTARWRGDLGFYAITRLPSLTPLIAQFSKRQKALAAGVCFLVGVVGIATYMGMQAAQERAAREERVRQIEEAAAQAPTETENTPIAYPWSQAPALTAMIRQCLEQYAFQTQVEKGWEVASWQCSPGLVNVEWQKLPYGIYNNMPDNAEFDPESPDTTHTAQLLPPLSERGHTPLISIDVATRYFSDLFLIYGIAVEMADQEGIFLNGFSAKKLTLRFDRQPSEKMYQLISAVPGLVLEHIKIDQQRIWEMKGLLYVVN